MKLILPILVIAAVIFGYLALNKSGLDINKISLQKKSTTSPSPQILKTFKSSSVMKLTIDVPTDYEVEEKFTSVTLRNSSGEIYIGKNGTNFSNLRDYIKNSKNDIESRLTARKELTISGLEATSGIINNEKTYFIYAENNVYIVSTKDQSLFTDLDQIAQSFRYTP